MLFRSRYAEFFHSLDAEMTHIGLSRYGGKSPGMSELHGRDILAFDYRFQVSDKFGFLGGQDIVKAGLIEIYVYSSVPKDDQIRAEAMTRLVAVLNSFGARLEERTEKNFGPGMDLKVYEGIPWTPGSGLDK